MTRDSGLAGAAVPVQDALRRGEPCALRRDQFAQRAGFRACKRCRPNESTHVDAVTNASGGIINTGVGLPRIVQFQGKIEFYALEFRVGLHAALIHTAVMQVSWTMRIMILTYVVPCALQNSIDCTDLQAFFMGN